MIREIGVSVFSGLTCGMLLNIFYLALKHVWPENYFGLSGSVDPIVSRNLARWALFRLIPPAIAAAAAAVTAERADSYFWLAGGLAIVVHVRRLLIAAGTSLRRRYRAAALQEVIVTLLVASVMVGAILVRGVLASIIPEPKDLVSNVWAGFLAAVGAVYLQRIVLLRREPGRLLQESFGEIPMFLKVYLWGRAQRFGVDPSVPLAVMAAENLQRPLWLRRLERMIPTCLGGTRYIMQQEGATCDEHSIDLAFERNFYSAAATESPWTCFATYNSVPEFRDLAYAAHRMLVLDPSELERIERVARQSGNGVG